MQSIASISGSRGDRDLTSSFLGEPSELITVFEPALVVLIYNVRLVLEAHAFVRRDALTLVSLVSRSDHLVLSSRRG